MPTTAPLTIPATVYVVSHQVWDDTGVTSGGFTWHTTESGARAAYTEEVAAWAGCTARVRLVLYPVPEPLQAPWSDHNRAALTDWIDARIEMVEDSPAQGGLPALAVALIGVPAHAHTVR